MDEFTETNSQSWLGRIVESIKGIAFGFLLIAGAVFLLSYNENRAVKTAKSLKEGTGVFVAAVLLAFAGSLLTICPKFLRQQSLRHYSRKSLRRSRRDQGPAKFLSPGRFAQAAS